MRKRQTESSFSPDMERAETAFRQPLFADTARAHAPAKSPAAPRKSWLIWVLPPILVGLTALLVELTAEPPNRPPIAPRPSRAEAVDRGEPKHLADLDPRFQEIQARPDPRQESKPPKAAAEAPPVAAAAPAPSPAAPAQAQPPSPSPLETSTTRDAVATRHDLGRLSPLPEGARPGYDPVERRPLLIDADDEPPPPRRADPANREAPQANARPAEQAKPGSGDFYSELRMILKQKGRTDKEMAESIQAICRTYGDSNRTPEMGLLLADSLLNNSYRKPKEDQVRYFRKQGIPDALILKWYIKEYEMKKIGTRNGYRTEHEAWIGAANGLLKMSAETRPR